MGCPRPPLKLTWETQPTEKSSHKMLWSSEDNLDTKFFFLRRGGRGTRRWLHIAWFHFHDQSPVRPGGSLGKPLRSQPQKSNGKNPSLEEVSTPTMSCSHCLSAFCNTFPPSGQELGRQGLWGMGLSIPTTPKAPSANPSTGNDVTFYRTMDEGGQLDFRTIIFIMIHLFQVQKDRLGHTPSHDKPKLV